MKEVELYDHQRKAVARLCNGKILTGGVGSGKSRVAMQYYFQNEWESDLIVITTAKKRDSRDWEDEAAKFGIGTESGATLGRTITVDSWNNLWRYVDRENCFFIFDEQRLVGSGAWVKVFLKIVKNNQWILLSATPGDTWLDYIPVFVANGLYKNRTEFLREHVVYSRYSKFPKVERYIGVGRLVKHRNDLLVDMPYERMTTRHINLVDVDYDVDLLKKVVKERWHVYENRPLRDVAELFSVMRKVVNSDVSRKEALLHLLEKHPKLIVFYNFDYELEILRQLTNGLSEQSFLPEELPKTPNENEQNGSTLLEKKISSLTTRDIPSLTSDSQSTRTFDTAGEKKMDALRSEAQPIFPERTSSTTEQSIRSTSNSKTESIESFENSLSRSDLTLTSQKSGRTYSSSETLSSTKTRTPKSSSVTSIGSSSPNQLSSPTMDESISLDLSQMGKEHIRPSLTTTNGSTGAETKELPCTLLDLTSVQIAEWNGHKHQPIPTSDRWVYLVQYTAGAEGWNCVETNAVCFYSLNYSYRVFEQCQGRIDRLNTLYFDLFYYVLRSKSAIDEMIWKAVKTKKFFNENSQIKKGLFGPPL